jgi:hypothetical protein
MKYTIHVDEIGQILSTKQPIEKFNPLVAFLNEQWGISINMDSDETSGAESEKLSISQNGEEYQSTPDLTIDADDTSGDEAEELNKSQDSTGFTPAVEEDEGIDFGAGIWHQNYEYGFYGEEREEQHTMVLTGGAIFITESNKGNRWLVCVKGTAFSSGAMKEMYPISWVLSIKSNNSIAYKDIPGKYILNLFREDRIRDLPKFFAEKKTITLYDRSTKRLFHIEENQQFGFIMRNYGLDLFTIAGNKQVSFADRLKIAILYVDEVLALFEQGRTHGDLKLENACYHSAYHAKGEKIAKEKVTLIDLDSMCSIKKTLKIPEEMPTCTGEYLHQFFKEGYNIRLLGLGQYRLIHDLWAMTIACNQLIFRSNECEPFFLEKLNKIHTLLGWVSENPDKLSQDKMLKVVYKCSLEFSDILIDELDDYFQNSLAIDSVENSPSAEKAEESKPDVIMQGSDETKGSSVECVGLNEKENQENVDKAHEKDESKKGEGSSASPFWKDISDSPNKRQRIEQQSNYRHPAL